MGGIEFQWLHVLSYVNMCSCVAYVWCALCPDVIIGSDFGVFLGVRALTGGIKGAVTKQVYRSLSSDLTFCLGQPRFSTWK